MANITRHYRQAIDAAVAGRPVEFSPRDVEEMELSFSRGFSPGWLEGCDHKRLVPGLSSAKHGVRVGQVRAVRGRRVLIELTGSLKRGDGVVFAGDRTDGGEQGGRVFEIFRDGKSLTERIAGGRVELAFGRGALDLAQLLSRPTVVEDRRAGADAQAARVICAARIRGGTLPVDLIVQATVGAPLAVKANLRIRRMPGGIGSAVGRGGASSDH